MSYTGEVEVGGPAEVREVGDIAITKLAVGPMANNAYLLRCLSTGEQVLIDAADQADRLLELVGDAGLTAIVTTHRHPDHVQALPRLAEATGAELIAGRPDADHLPVDVDRAVWDGDTVAVGTCSLEVIGLTGHTPGSIALAYVPDGDPVQLFTGDSLFPGGVGRTTSDDDFVSLVDDVETKLFGRFDDTTWFYPGHGNDSTLGTERPQLPEWRQRGW